MRIQVDTKLEAATVARAVVTRADGTVEDLGILSIALNPRSPRQWWRLIKNIRRYGGWLK